MKKLFLIMMMGSIANLLSAQCVPSSPAPVFDTVVCTAGTNVSINGIPSGVVVRLEVPTGGVSVAFDMCQSNSPSNNDSYLTLLDANNNTATSLDYVDDGCGGPGPTLGSFFIATAGTYFVYVTEFDINTFDACVVDANNTNFVMDITVTASTGLTNDDCDNATPLTLGTTLYTTNDNATANVAVEGVGYWQDSTLADIGIFAPSNYPNGVNVGNPFWYSFNAAVAGSYIITFINVELNRWGYDLAIYRASDISCSDIYSSDLANGIYRALLSDGDTLVSDTVTLTAGNYLMPVSDYYSNESNFSITITKTAVDESCATAAAGSITINPACITYGDNVFVYQVGPFNVPNVGNIPNHYTLIGTGPITNFATPANDPNYYSVFEDYPLEGGFGIYTVDPDFGTVIFPVGTYYYYFLSSGNTHKENDVVSFDVNCLAKTTPAVFQVVAVGDSNCTVGIEEATMLSLQLYPNPATNMLNISMDHANMGTYQIMNSNGQLYLTGDLTGTATIDISSLPSGVYLFAAATQQQQVVKRFMVIK